MSMRPGAGALLFVVSAWASVSAAGRAADAGVDLHGIARHSARSAPDVVVWLDAPNAPPTAQRSRVVLNQRDLTFSPHVLAVRVGTVVDFPNDDRVFHNVFSFHDGKRFDLGMYPVGALRRVTFDRPGLSRIFCNIHPNMAAYVMVVDTPYFAVSDRSGTFTIASVSPGRYTYHAWRPGVDQMTGVWTSSGDAQLTIDWP